MAMVVVAALSFADRAPLGSAAAGGPTIWIGDASLVKGSSGATSALQFPVALSEPASIKVSVQYRVTDGTATAPDDYSNLGGVTRTLNFAASTNASTPVVKYISVPVRPDTLVEPDETFAVTLSAPTGGYALGRAVATGSILNTNPGSGGRLSIGDASIAEGNTGGMRIVQVPVTLSAPPPATVTVQYKVTDGTATAPSDYLKPAATSLTFPASTNGTTPVVKYVSVSVVPNTLVEPDKTFTVTLSAPTGGYTIGRAVGTVTILNDDAPSPFPTSASGHYLVAGQPFVAYGSTMYPYWAFGGSYLRGDGWHHAEFTQYIDTVIAMAQQAHLNVLRPTDYLEGDSNAYDPTVWANMDYLVSQAAAKGLMIVMDLSAYRKFLQAKGLYAYAPTAWNAYADFVGARYANAINVLTYSISGEPPCPTGTDPLRPKSTAGLTTFYQSVSTRLHTADHGHHLIEAGGLIHLNQSGCGIDWQSIYALPYVRAATIHVYSSNDQSITAPMVSAWAASKGYPFEIQEFGFQQGVGDAVRAGDYQTVYNLARTSSAAMTIVWNLGQELAPTSYEVNPNTPLAWQTVISNAPQ